MACSTLFPRPRPGTRRRPDLWLHQHPDFDQLLLRTADSLRGKNLSPAAIEKDYYITEVLRRIAASGLANILFKGGTSLSKGWGLIERFSEDVDIFLDPESFAPPLQRKCIDRECKRLRDAVARIPGLTLVSAESRTLGGVGRADVFAYRPVLEGLTTLAPRVLLEVGTASGREPAEIRSIQSFVGQFLADEAMSLGSDNESAFSLRLLHFRRTFIEKLFAIHSKVALLRERGGSLGSYARHYYDLHQLGRTQEVLAMLRSDESQAIRSDYDRVSKSRFARDYRPPPGLRFDHSVALFPDRELERELKSMYEVQARQLCFGPFPSWREVRGTFEALREWL